MLLSSLSMAVFSPSLCWLLARDPCKLCSSLKTVSWDCERGGRGKDTHTYTQKLIMCWSHDSRVLYVMHVLCIHYGYGHRMAAATNHKNTKVMLEVYLGCLPLAASADSYRPFFASSSSMFCPVAWAQPQPGSAMTKFGKEAAKFIPRKAISHEQTLAWKWSFSCSTSSWVSLTLFELTWRSISSAPLVKIWWHPLSREDSVPPTHSAHSSQSKLSTCKQVFPNAWCTRKIIQSKRCSFLINELHLFGIM